MRIANFTVPSGVDKSGKLVRVEEALDGVTYRCPANDCNSCLILRRGRKPLKKSGRVKVTHFAHKPGTNCNPDRVTHALAQHNIVSAVSDWKAGTAAAPIVLFTCHECWTDCSYRLPENVDAATLEYKIEHEGKKYRLDVALEPFSDLKLAVEVHQTNYVEDQKEADLVAAGIIHFEVEAVEINQSPSRWRLINSPTGFEMCADCTQRVIDEEQRRQEEAKQAALLQEQREREEQERALLAQGKLKVLPAADPSAAETKENWIPVRKAGQGLWGNVDFASKYREEAFALAVRLGVRLPRQFYRYLIVDCWNCNNDILVYTWPGKRKWDQNKPYCNYEPMPSTLREVVNKMTRRPYWANTCPVCEAVQGDDYLRFPVFPSVDTRQAFAEDIRAIAHYYYESFGPL